MNQKFLDNLQILKFYGFNKYNCDAGKLIYFKGKLISIKFVEFYECEKIRIFRRASFIPFLYYQECIKFDHEKK